ncbi:hypothetical protein U9523_26250, partial [Escherichia coli]
MTDFGGKTGIFSHPVYLFLRKFSLQDSRGGSDELIQALTLLDVKQQELQKQTALNELKKKTIQLTSQLAEEER